MDFPWYESISGVELEQGHVVEGCPVFFPPEDLENNEHQTVFLWAQRDVIVLTQSCDLFLNREKVAEVLLCPLWNRSEFTEGFLATPKGMEEARRGNLPAFHVISACSLPSMEREVRVVDFRRVYSLPLGFVRKVAAMKQSRLRLLPPYREHLAQAFARFFMRVGLPIDIPAFKK